MLWFFVFSFYTEMIIEVVADDDNHFLLSYIEGKQKCKQVQNIKKLSAWKLQLDYESAIWVL